MSSKTNNHHPGAAEHQGGAGSAHQAGSGTGSHEQEPHLEIPDLQPPGPTAEEQPGPAMNRRGLLMLLLVAFTFFLLLDVAILAYFLWPDSSREAITPVERPVRELDKSPAPPSPEQQGQARPDPAAREQAITARSHWLDRREEAEAAGVRAWAGQELAALLQSSDTAGKALADGHPQQAARLYDQAAAGLQALLTSRPERFARAMERGNDALAQGRTEEAQTAFTLALAIQPDDARARKGLARATRLDNVVNLYEKGMHQAELGRRAEAISLLEQAVQLDSEWATAGLALTQLRQEQRQERFSRAMGAFHQAMQSGKTDAAGQALTQAARFRPDAPAVAQARRELARLRTRQQLDRLTTALVAAQQSESWQKTLDLAEQMLQLDADNGLALAARKNAQQQKELQQRLAGIIAHPERLAEDTVLAEAEKILAAARAVAKPGPKLQEQIAQAGKIVTQAVIPVTVTLRSDGATEVTIYHVGRLGQFAEKTVRLRPGRYTVVGIRPGFRDVRRQILVRAQGNEPLVIRCTETI